MSSQASGETGLTDRVDRTLQSKDQQREAKRVVKAFVKEMVKGKKTVVVTSSGQMKSCTCYLSRKLDVLKIKVGTALRKVPLMEVSAIHCGTEAPDIDTPLDELCATVELESGEFISFRFPDITARDTYVMCMLMFAQAISG